jgi:hypothetical protein
MNISEKQRLITKIKTACTRAQSAPTAELFVLILYDLIKEFDDNAELKPVIEGIHQQAKLDLASILDLETKALNQMRFDFKKLISYFTTHKITMHSESPWNPFKLFNGCEDGTIQVTNPVQERYWAIENILRFLIEQESESGLDHTDFLSQFGEFDEQKENIKLDFAPAYFEYMAALQHLEDIKEHYIWHSWDVIVQIYLTRKSHEQITTKDRENGKILDLWYHVIYRNKLNTFMKHDNGANPCYHEEQVFDLTKLKHHIHRLCEYAVDVIEKIKEDDSTSLPADTGTVFIYKYTDDIRQGILRFGTKQAKLTGNGAALLNLLLHKKASILTIYANKVMADNEGLGTREKKEQVRSAYRTTNNNILHELGVPDFIICEDDAVSIKSCYASSCRLSTDC